MAPTAAVPVWSLLTTREAANCFVFKTTGARRKAAMGAA
jgi:hypothetical protein